MLAGMDEPNADIRKCIGRWFGRWPQMYPQYSPREHGFDERKMTALSVDVEGGLEVKRECDGRINAANLNVKRAAMFSVPVTLAASNAD